MSKRLDYFKIAAAFMVVAIHTAPLGFISERADFLVTYCLFRVAVPFFLMVTGYFVVADDWNGGKEKIDKFLAKMVVLYIVSTLLYLPVNLYAGKTMGGVGEFFRILLFEGTFYHLWYLPAVIWGCVLVRFLHWAAGIKGSGLFVLILYIIGTLGDSYYGLVSQTVIGANFYEGIFAISDYTRNGIFYAPLFLWLGAAARRQWKTDTANMQANATGLLVSLFLLVLEGLWTYEQGWQRHNSMYFMLPVVVYFIFKMLVQGNERKAKQEGETEKPAGRFLRDISLWIYILHPLAIVLVRGGAKVVGLTGLFVEQSLVHFLAVSAVSAGMALGVCLVAKGIRGVKGASPRKGA